MDKLKVKGFIKSAKELLLECSNEQQLDLVADRMNKTIDAIVDAEKDKLILKRIEEKYSKMINKAYTEKDRLIVDRIEEKYAGMMKKGGNNNE